MNCCSDVQRKHFHTIRNAKHKSYNKLYYQNGLKKMRSLIIPTKRVVQQLCLNIRL